MSAFLRKYNTLLVTGTTAIRIPIIKRGVVDFAVSADWTPAAGDVKVWVDGTAANITNLPTAINSGNCTEWEFILTAAELSCKSLHVVVTDSATKAVEDTAFSVETFGHASAMYPVDYSDSVRFGLTALPAAPPDSAGGLIISDAGGLDIDAVHAAVTSGTHGNAALKAILDTSGVVVASIANNAITAAAIADGAIDRATFAADTGLQTIRSGTAQAGGGSQITLDASASASDAAYVGDTIYLTGGTGAGGYAICTQYTGATKVALVEPAWQIASPDNTTTFAILPRGNANVVMWGGATAAVSNFTQVYSTDFLTNYDASSTIWNVNVQEISHDATAANNLELQFDGTGLSGNTFPATQNALASLVTTVGAAGAGLTEAGGTGDHLTALATQASVDAVPTVSEIWTTALTEAYRATGATGTGAQLLYELLANLINFANAGTLKTVTKLDKSTTAKTYTYDDSTTPTAIEETT